MATRFVPPTARQGIAKQCTIGMLACIPLITLQAHAKHAAERATEGVAPQFTSGSNQIASDPRRFNASF